MSPLINPVFSVQISPTIIDLFFWTGDCLPDYEALEYTYDHHIMNLNGGDTRFDNQYPSYTFVSPLFRQVDGLRQYLATASNENIYTNGWEGPFYGFRYVIETFKRTESPIRIRPIDIYYHFFATEKRVSLNAIESAYEWSLSQEIAPVFASEYIKTARGFLETRITKKGANRWNISNNGQLKTIRFDDTKKHVDLRASRGIIGYLHHQGSLYVHLADGQSSDIVLTSAKQNTVHLKKANGYTRKWKATAAGVDFELRTMSGAQAEIGGLTPNRAYSLNLAGKKSKSQANKDGVLTLEGRLDEDKLGTFEWVKIAIR